MEACAKNAPVELPSMVDDRDRIKAITIGFEADDGRAKILDALAIEKYAGDAFDHRIERAPLGQRNDGPAGSHAFHRDNAEILVGRKEQRSTLGEILPQDVTRLRSEQADRRAGDA